MGFITKFPVDRSILNISEINTDVLIMGKIKVAIVAFENISAFHLSVPCLIFRDALDPVENPFDVNVCCRENQAVPTSSGYSLNIKYSLEIINQSDIVIIPSWGDIDELPSDELIQALRHAYRKGATLVGLCLGAFALAATGLLDGYSATTHWAYSEPFSQQFPEVKFDPEPLYIEHDRLITSAGTVEAIDCCLHIARSFLGNNKVSELARLLVTAPYRHGGQKQYIPLPVPEKPANKTIAMVMDKMIGELNQPHSIESAAEQCAMSRRTFTRQFRALTGISFGEWLLNQRLQYSQQLLEHSDHSIHRIAELSGFGSESAYRKHFKKTFNVSPRDWRTGFQDADQNSSVSPSSGISTLSV